MMLPTMKHTFGVDTDICVKCGASAEQIEEGVKPRDCPGGKPPVITTEWLRKFDDIEEPSGCPACGLIAGCCQNYPDCPGGAEQQHENGDGV